jgi:subtilisin family serine protease
VTADGSNRRKPDLSAPGVGVRSAWPENSVNALLSGTSMAAPHVAGAVALLWSAAPELIGDVDLTEQILVRNVGAAQANSPFCPSGESSAPNNIFGFGSLDVLAAVLTAQQPATVTLYFATNATQPVTVTQAALVDPLTGYTYPAGALNGNLAEWPRVYAGQFQVVLRDSQGSELTLPQPFTVTRGATIAETLAVTPQNHSFFPIIVR